MAFKAGKKDGPMPGRDVDTRRIVAAGVAIACSVALAVLAVFALLHSWHTPAGSDSARLPYALRVEGAALQSAPQLDLAQYRAQKQSLLESSAWVDPAQGIVRIPIGDAMQLLASSAASAASAARGKP